MTHSLRSAAIPLKKAALYGALIGAAALLASCRTGIDAKIPTLICPATGFVKDTTSLTRFRAGGSYQPADVLYEAEVAGLATGCVNENGTIVETVSFTVNGEKGPAFGGDQVSIPYFVAITTKAGQIVAKEVYDAPLSFDSAGRASIPQRVQQSLMVKAPRDTANYEVLIGLQLSDDDLVYNISQ